MYGAILSLMLIISPVEAIKPIRNIPTMYIGVSDTFESRLLKQEIKTDWLSLINPEMDEKSDESCRKLAEVKFNIEKRVKIKILTPEEDDTIPYDWPVYRFSRYQKWEKFPKKAFSYSTCPTLTLQYIVDCWFVDDFREELEKKRREYNKQCSDANSYILVVNAGILRQKYGDKVFNPIIEKVAIYQFKSGKWYKISVPTDGRKYLLQKERETPNVIDDDNSTSNHFFFADGYITGYHVSGFQDIINKKDWKTKVVPAENLNVYLSPGAFPKVDVNPSPPWGEKYSFVPF